MTCSHWDATLRKGNKDLCCELPEIQNFFFSILGRIRQRTTDILDIRYLDLLHVFLNMKWHTFSLCFVTSYVSSCNECERWEVKRQSNVLYTLDLFYSLRGVLLVKLKKKKSSSVAWKECLLKSLKNNRFVLKTRQEKLGQGVFRYLPDRGRVIKCAAKLHYGGM